MSQDTQNNPLPQDKGTVAQGRLLIFIVAYNAEKTIESVLQRIPEILLERYDVEVLIIDDSSQDETFKRSELVRRAGLVPFKMTVLYNPDNQGYGGNQKIGFHYAVERNFDWVALVHGDGQYAPECLPELVKVLEEDDADAVFGSRMLEKKGALKGGMPLYKYVGNKILTTYQNFMLGSELSEFHSGYRLYSIAALRNIPFSLNSNDFHFDTEIIIQLIFAGMRIKELPIPTFYGDEICHVNGMKYAWDVFKATFIAKVQPLHILYEPKFDCQRISTPEGQESLSESLYVDTLLGAAMEPNANILLVGNAPARLKEQLQEQGHKVTIESRDFFEKNTTADHSFDYLFLLDESGIGKKPDELMHKLMEVSRYSPQLKICVKVSNIGFILTRLLLLLGRFGYTRKGIINLQTEHFFTLRSARKMFVQNGFSIIDIKGLPTPYAETCTSQKLQKTCSSVHSTLIRLRKSLFSFHFVFFVRAPTSLPYLLKSAVEISGRKANDIDLNGSK